MWESAQSLSADVEGVAELLYDTYVTNKVPEDQIQALLNVIVEIKGYLSYIEENFAEKSEVNVVKIDLKKHIHFKGKVITPKE